MTISVISSMHYFLLYKVSISYFFLASAFNNNKTLYVLIGHASHANPKKNILPIMFVVFCDETRNWDLRSSTRLEYIFSVIHRFILYIYIHKDFLIYNCHDSSGMIFWNQHSILLYANLFIFYNFVLFQLSTYMKTFVGLDQQSALLYSFECLKLENWILVSCNFMSCHAQSENVIGETNSIQRIFTFFVLMKIQWFFLSCKKPQNTKTILHFNGVRILHILINNVQRNLSKICASHSLLI